MPAAVNHVVLNIDPENLGFYRDLFAALGWPTLVDMPEHQMIGVGEGLGSVWIGPNGNGQANDRDGVGMNHLALNADSVEAVDAAAAWIAGRGVPALYETPRHRPDFAWGEGNTYYQVMFDSPDKVLIEVVYTGPYSA